MFLKVKQKWVCPPIQTVISSTFLFNITTTQPTLLVTKKGRDQVTDWKAPNLQQDMQNKAATNSKLWLR